MTKSDAKRIIAAMSKHLKALQSPEELTVSQFADKYRVLPSSSAEPGPWRTSRTPYLEEPMNAFSDPKVRRIVMAASSQTGKTELELNCIAYAICQDPGNILYIHPDDGEAKKFSQLRVAPTIRESPALMAKVAKAKSRDSANTISQKTFPGGTLIIVGSNVPSDLASTPARYVFGDERDRWAKSAGKEGDPWELAMARQITFYNSKAVEVSTPTIKNASAIEKSFNEGTMERWSVACPHCGEYNDIKFSDIRFEKEEKIVRSAKHYTVSNILYCCPKCGCLSSETDIKKSHAKWIAENPEAYARGIRSFWLNSFVSPWASWEKTILEWLNAIGNIERMQVVKNTRFGELWEDRGDIEDEESVMSRREEYEAELPDGVLVLTCGVDTQDNRLEYEIVGFGHFGESWGIRKGLIIGRPDDDATWQKLDAVIDKIYRFKNGIGLPVSLTFVDEGGHFTQNVRQQCRARLNKHVFAIAGSNQYDAPYTAAPREQKILTTGRDGKRQIADKCWRYDIGVSAGKRIIMSNLSVQAPGPNYCHFPMRDDYGAEYFRGLLSERLEYDPKKKHPWAWVKIPGHERNEALDCRNYATAAFKALPKDLDAIARKLAEARGEKMDEPVAVIAPAPAQKRKSGTRKNRTVDKMMEDW